MINYHDITTSVYQLRTNDVSILEGIKDSDDSEMRFEDFEGEPSESPQGGFLGEIYTEEGLYCLDMDFGFSREDLNSIYSDGLPISIYIGGIGKNWTLNITDSI